MEIRLSLLHQAGRSIRHLLLVLFLLISACSPAQKTDSRAIVGALIDPGKVLIVYLSRTNNTRAVAEYIHSQVGGKLVSLELVTPYPQDYRTTVDQVARENETGFLPPLKTRIDSIEKYEVVYPGFPTWGIQLPPPMKSFLRQYDLKGKTVIPFNTNAGYGLAAVSRR